MNRRPADRGFTIVELLVVASIMAMLFGLILVGGRSNAGNEVRRAARQIAGILLSAQSRAIGSRTGAAVLFESDGNPQTADPKNNRAVRVRDADMAPAITANVISPFQISPFELPPPSQDVPRQTPPFRPDLWIVHIPVPVPEPPPEAPEPPVNPDNANKEDLDAGYRIRFGNPGTPWSPWYGFLPRGEDRNFNGQLDNGEDLAFGPDSPKNGKLDGEPLVIMRFAEGQTPENTVWPATIPIEVTIPVTEPLPRYAIEIARYPGAGTPALELSATVAIDLRYSGHGNDPSPTTWGYLGSKGLVGLSFNTVGAIDTLMQNVTGVGGPRVVQPLVPMQPIYFFVVPRADLEADLAAQPGAVSTLASDRAAWLTIEPQSGRVTVAANQPQTLAAGAAPTSDLLQKARKLVRAGSTAGE